MKVYSLILFLSLLFYSRSLFAQETFEADLAYTKKIDSLMINLDKSDITTGVFYPRVLPIAGLDDYNSVENPADDEFIIRATKELFLATYDTTSTMNPNAVFNNEDSYGILGYDYGSTYLPYINIVNYDYNTVDTLAYDKNLFSFSNGFPYDVPGRTISPYLQKRVLLAGLIIVQ